MSPDHLASQSARSRFEREAMAIAQLASPHVVQIYDYGIDTDAPYIVMELLEGEDLQARLTRLRRLINSNLGIARMFSAMLIEGKEPPLIDEQGEAVKVACSTLCFSRLPLDRALKTMEELEFTKVDAAITPKGPHMTPADVAADPSRCARLLRYTSTVTPAALNLEFDGESEDRFGREQIQVKDEAHYLVEARTAFEKGNFESALRLYSRVLEFNPQNAAAWTAQGSDPLVVDAAPSRR